MKAPIERFSDRVTNYVRYRPSYPEAVVDTLIDHCSLTPSATLADIGSGTGIFTRQLLDKQLNVLAVEPNEGMRHAAEAMLSHYPNFTTIDGRAEVTTLGNDTIDLIVSAQAFHWFRYAEAIKEFRRILKTTGWVGLVWNERKRDHPFQQAYEAILYQFAPEYSTVKHTNVTDSAISAFFEPQSYRLFTFSNEQRFDKNGFLGRMQSSSYTPPVNSPEYIKLEAAASQLFAEYEQDGKNSFAYETRLYVGKLKLIYSDARTNAK